MRKKIRRLTTHDKPDILKTIGMIGGVSYISTLEYYRLYNEGINRQLGGLNFARCIIHSLNYADIKRNNDADDWDSTYQLVIDACLKLQASGAEAILLCANTMHLIADRLQAGLNVPIIHIARETALEIQRTGLQKVALLGTRFTMERDFFRDKLSGLGIQALIPEADDREFVQHTIYEELGRGLLLPATKIRYLSIIEGLIALGAEGVILGCTEIPMLIQAGDVPIPCFDTTSIHTEAAVRFALS